MFSSLTKAVTMGVIVTLATGVYSADPKTEPKASKVDRLFDYGPQSVRKFPDLTSKDIPDLMQRVGNKNSSNLSPVNPVSSIVPTMPVSWPEGIVAAWLIEGILIGGEFPSQFPMAKVGEDKIEGVDDFSSSDVAKVSAIYQAWWEKAKDMSLQKAQESSPKRSGEVRWR